MGMKKKEINYQLLIRRICLIVLDIICIIAASILALLTRFEFDFSQIPKEFLKVIYKYGPFTIVITLIIFSLFRIYSSLWEYAGIDRCSDITIGDFWSLKEFHPEMLNQYGVSSVIIHSKKGERWFKDCLDQLIYCVAKTEEIAIWNESLINTIDKDHYRNQFYEMWNNKKIEEIVYELNQSKIKTRNKQNKAIACIKRIVRRIKNG